ncbi:MAG TPA: ANTAR domain-containing protein [Trebonia sp.]
MSVNGPNEADQHEDVVVRRADRGWVVGDENVADLTSAMVLADLFAADQAGEDSGAAQPVDESAQARPESRPTVRPSAPAPRENHSGAHRIPAGFADRPGEADEAARLAVTVAQLEHALASRVRVEQAIGVLAERHRLRPREAFDLLRKASRSRGTRVAELAQDVVESTANPLLQLPDELSRQAQEPRQRTRSLRRGNGRHAPSS